MTFLNPLVLIGLTAAAIPVLLHLLQLRRLRTVDFSTLRFLEELQKSALRRLRIRQWLLLLLRTLVIITLVLAFARPALRGSSTGPVGRARTTLAIVVDDSPSMGLRNERGTLLSQAQEAVAGILRLSQDGDAVHLLPLSMLLPDAPAQAPHGTLSSAREAVRRLELSETSIPISEALPLAARHLHPSTDPNRELYVLSDNQATQWEPPRGEGADTLARYLEGVRVFSMDIPGPEPENASVSGVRVLSQILSTERPFTIQATVRNFGTRPLVNTVVSAYLEGRRVVQQTVTVAAASSVQVPLLLVPQRAGLLAGSVEIEDDVFPLDNISPFAIRIPERISVLLVGRRDIDIRFPLTALTLGGDSLAAGRFTVSVAEPGRLASTDLSGIDVIILTGVQGGTVADAERFSEFVRSGRGLIIFPAPGIDTSTVNNLLFRALSIPPARLTAISPAGDDDRDGFLSISSVDLAHPVFTGLFEEGVPGRAPTVETPHVTRAFGSRHTGSGQAVATLSDGTVFLAEYRPGTGRILQFAVDAGGSWSDFPFRGLFAPLLHLAVLYASMSDQDLPRAVAGETIRFNVRLRDHGAGDVYVFRRPDGREERLVPAMTGSPGLARFVTAPSPGGIATLNHAPAGRGADISPLTMITVEHRPAESDLRHAGPGARELFWRAHGLDPETVRRLTPGAAPLAEVTESRFGTELWHYLLILALLLALAESGVARDPGRGEEAPR